MSNNGYGVGEWEKFVQSLDTMRREELPPIYRRIAYALDSHILQRFGRISSSHYVGNLLINLREEDLEITNSQVFKPGHYVQWTIDTDTGPHALIVCSLERKADCHKGPDDSICSIAEFLNNDGVENSYEGPEADLRSGPITTTWHEAGYYTWQYLKEENNDHHN